MTTLTEKQARTLQSKIYEHRLKEVFAVFRSHQISPILIKGWASARNYPDPHARNPGDIDLAVSPAQYKRAKEIVETNSHRSLIDLHKGLRHLDALPFADLFANSQIVKLDSAEIRILRPEDHLRVLCVHWLTDGGVYKHKLWDVYHAIDNRPADFDWDRCLNVVGKKRRRWIVCTVALVRRHFGLNVSDTPFENEIDRLPDWFIKAIEREWNENLPVIGLNVCWRDRKMFWRQIKKRFAPNPIMSSVMCEAAFDEKSRLPYHVASFSIRAAQSLKRIILREVEF